MNKSNRYDVSRQKRATKQFKSQKTARDIDIDIARYCGEIKSQDQIFEMYREFDADYANAKESNPNLTKAEFRKTYTKINLDNLFRCLNSINKKDNVTVECDRDDEDLNLVMKALSLVEKSTIGGNKRSKKIQQVDKDTQEAAEALMTFYNYNSLPDENADNVEVLDRTIQQDINHVLERGAEIYHNLSDCAQSYMAYAQVKASNMLRNLTDNNQINNAIEYTKENMYSISMYIITVTFIGSTTLPKYIIKLLYDILTNYYTLLSLRYIGGICATRHVARKLELQDKLSKALELLVETISKETDREMIQTVLSYIKALNIFKSKAELESIDRKNELALLEQALESAKKEEQEILELSNAKKKLINAVAQLNQNTEDYVSTCENLETVTETRRTLRKRTKSIPRTKSTKGGNRYTKRKRNRK